MTIDRRQFLIQGGAFAASAASGQAQQAPVVDKGFARVDKIADGVYATIADGSKGMQALSNGGLIVGSKGVLIFEGHMQPEGAALEVEAARAVSKAPIRGAVDSHYHFDHTFGNVYYQSQKIPIIGHERVTTMMKENYAAIKGADKAPLLAPYEKKVAAATDPTQKQRAEGDLNAMKLVYGSIDAATLAYPSDPVGASGRKIDLGGLTAVIEYHPGHTPTDIIVRVPERDVVFAGDLLFNRWYPVSIDANMGAWRKVLQTFAGYGKRTQFVPGHGAVCGIDVAQDEIAVMDDLRAHAEKMMNAGASAEEATRRYTVPERFKNFPIFCWAFTVEASMAKYYAELKKG